MLAAVLAPLLVAGSMTVATVAPSDLLPDRPATGWERVDDATLSEEPTDLDFAEFARLEPDSVAHIDPESEVAASIVAAIDVWGREGAFVIAEVVRSPDNAVAATFVDQAAAIAIAEGLAASDPPFEGAWSYEGPVESGWSRIVSWSYGPYSMTMTQLALDERGARELVDLALDQANLIEQRVGPIDAAPPAGPGSNGGDSGRSWWPLVLIAGAIVVALVVLRRRAGRTPEPADDEPDAARSVDDIIAEARRGGRSSPGTGSGPADADGDGVGDLDEMIARARARAEVDRLDPPEVTPG